MVVDPSGAWQAVFWRGACGKYGSIASMPKLTFSLDDETVETLRKAAERLRKPQSLVVREAIAEYATREARLSNAERTRLLGVLKNIGRRAPTRPQSGVDRELREIRRSRRTGWTRDQR
jgi:hypothetical protein